MPESAEHLFLKENFLKILNDFSHLDIYGYTETERKKFDLSCLLERDLSRILVGQTLWNHARGIEKDIRTLLLDEESEIKVYLAKNDIKHYVLFDEIINDYKKSDVGKQLFKLKTIWLPEKFDADNLEHQQSMCSLLKNAIVDDILFNIVFGHLAAIDVNIFLDVSGIPGLNLNILYEIGTNGFINYPDLLKRLDMRSTGPIREKIIMLRSIGFLDRPRGASMYKISQKGKVFLDIVRRLDKELKTGDTVSEELGFILDKLGCSFVTGIEIDDDINIFSNNNYINLVRTVRNAKKNCKMDFENLVYDSNHFFLKL